MLATKSDQFDFSTSGVFKQNVPVQTEFTDAPAGTWTPYSMSLDTQFDGRISSGSDVDVVAVNLTAGETYVFTAWGRGGSNSGLSDSILALYNPTGGLITSNDDVNLSGGNRFSAIEYTAISSGTYYISVQGYNSSITGPSTGNYTIQFADNVYNVEQIADYMTEMDWGVPTPLAFDASPGSILTYNTSFLTSEGAQLADWAFEIWGMITGINFQEISSFSAADLRLNDNQSGAFGGPSSFNPATGEIIYSDVNISSSWITTYGSTIDSYSFLTYMHEIGHALGLGHAGPYDGSATFGADNLYLNDSYLMTIMSYFDQTTNTSVDADFALPITPMLADIVAIQDLYGASNFTINGGNTIWGEGSNVTGFLGDIQGVLFDGETNASIYDGGPIAFTLVDTGGEDLVNFANQDGDLVIDLNQLAFSSVGGLTNNVTIAQGSVIENAVTGSGADEIYGNSADNTLSAGDGDDEIFGRGGNDVLDGEAGADALVGGSGTNYLYGDGLGVALTGDIADAVYRLYQATLDRTPDTAGHAGWTRAIFEGELTLDQAAAGFVNSAEFQSVYGALSNSDFVTLLYNNVLDRAPDAGGFAVWNDRLDSGMTRVEAVLRFSNSQEFINNTIDDSTAYSEARTASVWSDEVYRLYQATLDRAPDLAGFTAWCENLSTGMTLETAAGRFVDSIEFQNVYGALSNSDFVTLLYNNVLDRTPDAGGLAAWTNLLDGGMSRADVVLGFSNSQEFITNTTDDLNAWITSHGPHDFLGGDGGENHMMGGILSDTFAFTTSSPSTNVIYDMEAWDDLMFDGFGYTSSAEVLANFTQSGADAVFSDQGVTVTITNTQVSALTDDMFVFV